MLIAYNECNPLEGKSASQLNNYVIKLHLRSISIHLLLKILTADHHCHAELNYVLT